ncbi:MAG: hypothetical protein AAGL49_02600 [Pseudomonadota bacterium]
MSQSLRLHATCIALATDRRSPLAGVLLLGPSGCGKSDFALRLIDTCPYGRSRLTADDYVDLTQENDQWTASAPEAIQGLIEVRGVGLVHMEAAPRVGLIAAVDLARPPARLPEAERFHPDTNRSGPGLALFRLNPFEASAASKARIAVAALLGGHLRHNDDE